MSKGKAVKGSRLFKKVNKIPPRFRRDLYAVAADIGQMYYEIKVVEKDQETIKAVRMKR